MPLLLHRTLKAKQRQGSPRTHPGPTPHGVSEGARSGGRFERFAQRWAPPPGPSGRGSVAGERSSSTAVRTHSLGLLQDPWGTGCLAPLQDRAASFGRIHRNDTLTQPRGAGSEGTGLTGQVQVPGPPLPPLGWCDRAGGAEGGPRLPSAWLTPELGHRGASGQRPSQTSPSPLTASHLLPVVQPTPTTWPPGAPGTGTALGPTRPLGTCPHLRETTGGGSG